jgi:hypothetical protein
MARRRSTTVWAGLFPDLGKIADESLGKEISRAVLKEIRDAVAKGNSPVAGWGKFAPYKNPDKYPGNQKSSRPVNLDLSGDMMKALTTEVRLDSKSRLVVEVGWFGAEEDIQVRARVHNSGERWDIKRRPVLPGKDDEWTERIKKIVLDLYSKRIARIMNSR